MGKQWQTIFLSSKITVDGDCSPEIKTRLLLGRKAMTNLDSILKIRDMTLLTKAHLVKAMVFPVVMYGYVNVKVTQSCPYLCDPMNYTVHGILQARILEWVAVPFSRWYSQPRDQTQVSCITGRFFTSWATREAHLSDFHFTLGFNQK